MANTNADVVRAEFALDATITGGGIILGQAGFCLASPYKMYHRELGGSYRAWSSDDGDREQTGKVMVTKTTEQMRLRYDSSNYAAFTVDGSGDLTLTPSGNNVILAAGVILKLGSATAYGTASLSGTIPILDANGDLKHIMVANSAAA